MAVQFLRMRLLLRSRRFPMCLSPSLSRYAQIVDCVDYGATADVAESCADLAVPLALTTPPFKCRQDVI